MVGVKVVVLRQQKVGLQLFFLNNTIFCNKSKDIESEVFYFAVYGVHTTMKVCW